MIVTEDMRVCEVLDMHNKMEELFIKHELNCAGCPGSTNETIKEAAEGHGVSLEVLLFEINQLLNK